MYLKDASNDYKERTGEMNRGVLYLSRNLVRSTTEGLKAFLMKCERLNAWAMCIYV